MPGLVPGFNIFEVDWAPALLTTVLFDGTAGIEQPAVGENPGHQGGIAIVGLQIQQSSEVDHAP